MSDDISTSVLGILIKREGRALTYNILWIDVGGRYPTQGQIRKKKADRFLIYIYEYEY
jgi:hypothetical protein